MVTFPGGHLGRLGGSERQIATSPKWPPGHLGRGLNRQGKSARSPLPQVAPLAWAAWSDLMRRILPAVLALVASPAFGPPPAEAQAPAAKPGRTELTAVAAPAPVPALRFELLPPGRDKLPGNAAVGYLKAAALQPPWPKDPDAARKQAEKLEKWDAARPDQLPAAEVADFLRAYQDLLRTADEAAR